jgi:FkbM family methyltransferase
MAEVGLNQFIYDIKNDEYKRDRESGLLPFIGHCIANVDKSASQNYQDIWALYENNFKRDGYFVEFGATNGVDSSNTVLLEKQYGWKGILAEPNSYWHDDLFENRNCNITRKCVYSQSGLTVDFLKVYTADLSTVKGFGQDDQWKQARENSEVTQVETISLFDLLEENNAPATIDYLSVDTEGTEYGILNAFFMQNQNKYRVKSITVEHNFTPMRDKIYEMMTFQGYERVYTEVSRWDDFYVNRRI